MSGGNNVSCLQCVGGSNIEMSKYIKISTNDWRRKFHLKGIVQCLSPHPHKCSQNLIFPQHFFRKETNQKNVFDVETSIFAIWGRRFPQCPLFWRVINFYNWYPSIQTSWVTSGNLSYIILMLSGNSGPIGPENKWQSRKFLFQSLK